MEKQSSETVVQPWDKALDTPISFADTKTPSRREMLMINDGMCPQACRPQTCWNLKADGADSYLSHHHPSEECPGTDHAIFEQFL